MNFRQAPTPDDVMRRVTEDIIRRAIKRSRKSGRQIIISKSAKGKGVDVSDLDPDAPEGRERLDGFLRQVGRHYTISGLGSPEDPDAVNWRTINLPFWRRVFVLVLVGVTFLMKGTPLKNRVYRLMGANIGRNVEIMQFAWLDHFRPELIFIGDNTLLGAYTRVTVHAYEGSGRFRYGIVEIGRNCVIGAGTGIGPIVIEDDVRTLPGSTLSPYFARIRAGSVVGFDPPSVKAPSVKEEGKGG